MKIEFVTPFFLPLRGGIETVVEELANGLGSRGHDIVVHTSNKIPNSSKVLPKYERHKHYLIKRYRSYPFSLFFPKFVYNDSIISMQNYSPLVNDYITVIYKTRLKTISPYGVATFDSKQRKFPLLSKIYDFILGKRTLSRVNKIFVMTNYEKKLLIKLLPRMKDKITVIPGGMRFNHLIAKSKKEMKYRFFLSIGRIAPSKKFEDIIFVLKDFPKFHFVLAGKDIGYYAKLKSIAEKMNVTDRFHYLGQVSEDQKIKLLQLCDVFIMPSSAEAFSLASLEAFYYASKVIGAESGGAKEIFKKLGGKTYKIGDLDDLTIQIKKVIEDNLKVNKDYSKKLIEEEYSWINICNKYEKEYEKI